MQTATCQTTFPAEQTGEGEGEGALIATFRDRLHSVRCAAQLELSTLVFWRSVLQPATGKQNDVRGQCAATVCTASCSTDTGI